VPPFHLAPAGVMYVKLPAPPPIPMVMAQVPPDNQAPDVPEGTAVIESAIYDPTGFAEKPSPEDLYPCAACCCTLISCYCNWPKCLGCYEKGTVVCLEIEGLCCKTAVQEGALCLCTKGEVQCVKPRTCCKLESQYCCYDCRCALPCDQEVPCMVTILGLTLIKDYACKCKCGEEIASKAPSVDSQQNI